MFTPLMVEALIHGSQAPPASASVDSPPASAGSPSRTPDGRCLDWGGGGGEHGGSGAVLTVLLTAIPFTLASFTHLSNCFHSQRTGERRLHIAIAWAVGAAAMVAVPLAPTPLVGFVLLTLSNMGVNGANAIQTGWLVALLDGPHRALGLPLYNTGAWAAGLGGGTGGCEHPYDCLGCLLLALPACTCSRAWCLV